MDSLVRKMLNQNKKCTHTHTHTTLKTLYKMFSSLFSKRELVACGEEIWKQTLWEAACRKMGLGIGISEHITFMAMMHNGPRSWTLAQAK